MRILIADDGLVSSCLLTSLVAKWGCDVIACCDGVVK
jgi:CheY-like chemotaxis protein